MNIFFGILTAFITILLSSNSYAKKITFGNISLNLPNDVYFSKKIGPDFEVYYFYKNNENILNMYIGNFPNKSILEQPLTYKKFNLEKQPNIEIPYWECDENKICLRTELLVSNKENPGLKIQFFYIIDNKNLEVSNNIIKSLEAPKIIIKPDPLISLADNTELPFHPCFYITLPKNTEINSILNIDEKNISEHLINNTQTRSIKTKRIGFIDISNTNTKKKEEFKKNTSIDFLPFFENLKTKFQQIHINTLNLSDKEHPYYKNIITIPFKFNENQYYSTIISEIRSDDDGLTILQILNSIKPSEDKDCKFEQ
ncbi:hypothetical protein KTJ32_11210 [Acinetobacter gyllenbergii]|uniref:hypothetical protein n=1 Tax=Acinetobacter gyllenbergii TaxID=134534 RepID=UPI0021D15777|nr:hypothetical protein [Acinetobacter gyllenbergii]MCU4581555.1 hypothetical protein [Acinetobacter gyllenbergii]